MKASLFSLIAAAGLLASSASFAAVAPAAVAFESHDPYDRRSKDFNYGYDRNHRVTPAERARWEAANRKDDRRDDRRDDRKDDRRDYKDDRRDDRKDDRKDDRRDYKDDRKDDRRDARNDRNSKGFNYGFDKKHRVTDQERARWEAAHRYGNRH